MPTNVTLKTPPRKPRPEVWSIVDQPLTGAYGYCDFENRRIEVHSDLDLPDLIEVLLHESLHGLVPDLRDTAIKRAAKGQLAVLLVCPRLKITLAEGMDG